MRGLKLGSRIHIVLLKVPDREYVSNSGYFWVL